MSMVPNIIPTSDNVHTFSGNVLENTLSDQLIAARLVEPGDLSSKNLQCQIAQRNSYGNRKYGGTSRGVFFFGTLSGAEPIGFGGI